MGQEDWEAAVQKRRQEREEREAAAQKRRQEREDWEAAAQKRRQEREEREATMQKTYCYRAGKDDEVKKDDEGSVHSESTMASHGDMVCGFCGMKRTAPKS